MKQQVYGVKVCFFNSLVLGLLTSYLRNCKHKKIGWIVGHNNFFLSWHKTHEKQLDSIIYQGAGFVQVTVRTAGINTKTQNVQRSLLKYQKLKFMLNGNFF